VAFRSAWQEGIHFVTAFRIVAAIAFALFMGAAAHAQTVNRVNIAAGAATPTGASFVVRMPVAYSDMELSGDEAPDPAMIVRMVTGATDDRIRFSASEIPYLPGKELKPLEEFMHALADKPVVAELLDVQHGQSGGLEALSFTLIDIAGGGNYFDVIRDNRAQYTLLIQFHREQRDEAATMKDAFFGSFRPTQ